MGKSHKFSFQLSGRKNLTPQNGTTTSSNNLKSKAQRILGAEAIDLNIHVVDKVASLNDCDINVPTSLSAHAATLSRSSTREEVCKDSIPIIKGKATSILGIFKDSTEGNKSVSHSVQSAGIRSSSKSWRSKIDDFLYETPHEALKHFSHPSLLGQDTDTKCGNHLKFGQRDHIATYIEQDMSTLSELPGDYSITNGSIAEMPLVPQNSHDFKYYRPTSSSSCPPATEFQKRIPGSSRDNYPREFVSSQRSTEPPTRNQTRSKNGSLPNAPHSLANNWSTESNHAIEDVAVDQHKKNSRTEIEFPDERSDIATVSKSSVHSIITNHYELPDTSPPELPYLEIPEFADIQLSGPWNETLEDRKTIRHSYFRNSTSPGSQNKNRNITSTVQCTLPIQEQTQQSPTEAILSHQPAELQSSNYDFPTTDENSKGATSESQHPQTISENEKIVLNTPLTSYLNSPISTESQSDTSLSTRSNTSIATLSEDEKELAPKIPVFLDTYLNDWDHSPISSLCIDHDSASSATILKNEPAYQKFSDESIHHENCSEMYSPIVLMEVARVGMVIQKTPVKDMIRGRRKENLDFNNTKELPSVNRTRDFSRNNVKANYDYVRWS